MYFFLRGEDSSGSCVCLVMTLGCEFAPRAGSPASQPADTVQAGLVSVTARQEALVERMGGQIDARARLDAQAVTASASASASTSLMVTSRCCSVGPV